MSAATNASITQRKDRSYVKQAIIEQNYNKKSLEDKPNETSGFHIVQRQFLICQVCFWCASYYTYDVVNWSSKFDIFSLESIQQCPSCCSKGTIESLPISQNQEYTYSKHI